MNKLKLLHYTDIEAEDVESGSKNLKIRWLITKEDGAKNFAMRLFEMAAGGNTPLHTHDWEHEVFILEGEGVVVGGQKEHSFKAGDVIFVPANELHQFRSGGERTVKFLCLIPYKE